MAEIVVSEKVVTFAPTVPTALKVMPSVERSMRKPVSVAAVSVQVRLIWVAVAVTATLAGAEGVATGGAVAGVVTVTVFEGRESPRAFSAST